MNISKKKLTNYVVFTCLCLAGIIFIHFYYPFLHPYESHILFAVTSILITLVVSLALKIPLNLNVDFRPFLIWIASYVVFMGVNVFLSPVETKSIMTDVVHKEIVKNTRGRDTQNYYALVIIPEYSLLRLKETARLRISKKAYEHLVPENYQAKVEVNVGFLKRPFIVGFNFHDKNKTEK